MKSGGKKSRGESPKQRMSNIDGHDLYADEVAVMHFLENTYLAGKDSVTKDAIFIHLRPHAVTGERITLAIKRLNMRRYTEYTSPKRDAVRLRRSMLSKELPKRQVEVVDGVRHIVCPTRTVVGYGFYVRPTELTVTKPIKPHLVEQ